MNYLVQTASHYTSKRGKLSVYFNVNLFLLTNFNFLVTQHKLCLQKKQ